MSIDISKIRPGDTVTLEYDGHPYTGPVWSDEWGGLCLGSSYLSSSYVTVTAHTPKPRPSLVERMVDAYYDRIGMDGEDDSMAAVLAVVREEIEDWCRESTSVNADFRSGYNGARRRILSALTPDGES